MRIGLDLDNTLIGYDEAFAKVAAELGFIESGWSGNKSELRSLLRARAGGEQDWQRVQGQVYGPRLSLARPLPGADNFILRARAAGHGLVIVSHKTRLGHFDPSASDLRAAALDWLGAWGCFDRLGFERGDVWFEDDRDAKIARITALTLDLFIDDLPEVIHHPGFPASTRGIVLDDWARVTQQVLT
jgi:hypothetical protein